MSFLRGLNAVLKLAEHVHRHAAQHQVGHRSSTPRSKPSPQSIDQPGEPQPALTGEARSIYEQIRERKTQAISCGLPQKVTDLFEVHIRHYPRWHSECPQKIPREIENLRTPTIPGGYAGQRISFRFGIHDFYFQFAPDPDRKHDPNPYLRLDLDPYLLSVSFDGDPKFTILVDRKADDIFCSPHSEERISQFIPGEWLAEMEKMVMCLRGFRAMGNEVISREPAIENEAMLRRLAKDNFGIDC